MKSTQINQSRKRPVNLMLNEELVSQAKGMTDNLSGVVEQLLTDFVMKQNSARQEKAVPPKSPHKHGIRLTNAPVRLPTSTPPCNGAVRRP